MITQIDISGFRSIKEASIPLKKLNILYGQNGSGKSSVMYAPYVFRNFCLNPNQRVNRFFDLGFINLGGFEEVRNQLYHKIYITIFKEIIISQQQKNLSYQLELRDNDINFKPSTIHYFINGIMQAGVALDLPYTLENKVEIQFNQSKLFWNGLLFENEENDTNGYKSAAILNSLYESIKNLEFISVRRGFFNQIFFKDERVDEYLVALQLKENKELENKISVYFNNLFDKRFYVYSPPNSTAFYLRTQNKRGVSTDLVNEGFGVNQTVYMLIKLLKKSTSLAFIEEPEIHLHPSAQAKLVDVFTEIIQNEGKQIFITTHSENIVSSALAKIASGELSRDDVQFYLAVNEDGETKILPQQVNDKGQIEGGLMNFMEAELSNLKTILGL